MRKSNAPATYEQKIIHRLNLVLVLMTFGFLVDLLQKILWPH